MKKLAVIHTTPVTIEPLKALAQELIAGCQVVNFLDDSILPQLAENGGDIRQVAERWFEYAKFAEQVGADCILSACSSVGEVAVMARHRSTLPIVRIDEAMAEEAVRRASRIGVAATLSTTLNPTLRLLQSKAEAIGKKVELIPVLIEAAYRKLMEGDKEGHDAELLRQLEKLAGETETVVLAQASMARVLDKLPASTQELFLSSPRSGMQQVQRILAETS